MLSSAVKSGTEPTQVTPARTVPNLPELFRNWPEKDGISYPLIVELEDGNRFALITGELDRVPALLFYPLVNPDGGENRLENISPDDKALFHIQLGQLMMNRGYFEYALWCFERGCAFQENLTEQSIEGEIANTYCDYLMQYARAIYSCLEKDPHFKVGYSRGMQILQKAHDVALGEGLDPDQLIADEIENLKSSFGYFSPTRIGHLEPKPDDPAAPQIFVPEADLVKTGAGIIVEPKGFTLIGEGDGNGTGSHILELSLLLKSLPGPDRMKLDGQEVDERMIYRIEEDRTPPFYVGFYSMGISFLAESGYPTGQYPCGSMTHTQSINAEIDEAIKDHDLSDYTLPQDALRDLFSEHHWFYRRAVYAAKMNPNTDYFRSDIASALDALQLLIDYGDESSQASAKDFVPITIVEPALSYADTCVQEGKYLIASQVLESVYRAVDKLVPDFDLGEESQGFLEQSRKMREHSIKIWIDRLTEWKGATLANLIFDLANSILSDDFERASVCRDALVALEKPALE